MEEMKDVFLIVKVQVRKGGDADGPDVVDILQNIITVGWEGEPEKDLGDVIEIKVLQGFCNPV